MKRGRKIRTRSQTCGSVRRRTARRGRRLVWRR